MCSITDHSTESERYYYSSHLYVTFFKNYSYKLKFLEFSIFLIFTSSSFFFFFNLNIFWPCCVAYRILIPWPGIRAGPMAVKVPSPNHWTARELLWVFCCCFLDLPNKLIVKEQKIFVISALSMVNNNGRKMGYDSLL